MMRLLLLLWCSLCLAGVPASEYQARRAALRKALPGSIIVLHGHTERERGDLRSAFFQEPNFLYLTGWREPGAALILGPDREMLFLPARSDVRERYTGRKLAPGDAGLERASGFAHVHAISEMHQQLAALARDLKVYTAVGSPSAEEIRKVLADRELLDVTGAIARLRMVKSAAEVALLQRSVDATIEAHNAAWRRAAAGLYEYQVAATMSNVYLERGCERNAYPPIVASGPNAVILHYMANKRRMDAGELLLMDVGAECSDYAADITRTIPVSGRFSGRQREIYDVVLKAQKAAIAAARPGMKLLGTGMDSLNGIALDQVRKHGLEKYYLHSLGHHIGLEVHDANDRDAPLASGMVFTIEPGVYIAAEGVGVRIEDVVLVTENGARVLSEALPREASEIERALARRPARRTP